jgi:Asp/Glu/hydantoin racemase
MTSPTPRRLLLINPNTSVRTTERLQTALHPMLPAGVELLVHTARTGASYIACEASHAVAGYAVLQTWAEARAESPEPLDGVLIGCFGDPGLFALRECSACPVTGLAEASFIEAAQHGRFAVVTGGERWKPMLERLALSLGMGSHLQQVHTVAPTGAQMLADPELALQHLRDACRHAAAAPGVRAIVVGGAGLAGYAAKLQADCPLPLIDSVSAGLSVLLSGRAPASQRSSDGCHAHWTAAPPALVRLAHQTKPG